MAGFFNNIKKSFEQNNLSSFLRDLSKMGTNYEDMIQNSYSIGYVENMLLNDLGGSYYKDDPLLKANLSLSDTSTTKNIPFYQRDYATKRQQYKKLSMQDEIEQVLDIITDESIIYDDNKYFCRLKNIDFEGTTIKEEDREKFIQDLNLTFKQIYNKLNMKDDKTAWTFFREMLIEGYLAFEIIYNENHTEVTKFKRLDPFSLTPGINSDNEAVWTQFKDTPHKAQTLSDSQIVFISYSSINSSERISYIERLMRPFNILRLIESTRVIWSIVNSQFRLKFLIPIGDVSRQKGEETLAKVMQRYNENLNFDTETGEFNVNGSPNLPMMRQWWFPVKNGEQPEVETVGGDGPDINDVEQLRYFRAKFRSASRIPENRFDRESGGGSLFSTDATSNLSIENNYTNFIRRLQSVYSEIITKPLFIAMALKYPNIKDDNALRSEIGITFNKNNIFEKLKQQEIITKQSEIVGTLTGLTDAEGNALFDAQDIIDYFMDLPYEFLQKVKKRKESKTEKTNPEEEGLDL